jgi:hypothetical protein
MQQRLRETEMREKAETMETTVNHIIASEKEVTEKKVRQELANELKQMTEIKRENELLKVRESHAGPNQETERHDRSQGPTAALIHRLGHGRQDWSKTQPD